MASTSETGHAKNVANFRTIISRVAGYGTKYNPGRPALQLPGLNGLYDRSMLHLDTVKTTKTDFDNATNARRAAFGDVRSFSTQVVNIFSSFEMPQEAIEDAKGHNRKIQGKRAKALDDDPEPTDATPALTETEEDKHISVSQQSYDSLFDNFKELVVTVIAQPGYAPNEKEFAALGLQEKLERLLFLNNEVVDCYTDWANARLTRDRTLYLGLTGMTSIVTAVKKYVLGVFKANSTEYRQISGIAFYKVKS